MHREGNGSFIGTRLTQIPGVCTKEKSELCTSLHVFARLDHVSARAQSLPNPLLSLTPRFSGVQRGGKRQWETVLTPEPTAEKKAVNDRLIPSPSPRPLSPRERENHSAHLEGSGAPRRSVVQVSVGLPLRPASVGRIEVDIPRTLTKRSHVLLSPDYYCRKFPAADYCPGGLLTKFAASSVLPLPLYFATCG